MAVALLGQLFLRNRTEQTGPQKPAGMLLEATPAVHAGAKRVGRGPANLQEDS
jgi:hypothetical protein